MTFEVIDLANYDDRFYISHVIFIVIPVIPLGDSPIEGTTKTPGYYV